MRESRLKRTGIFFLMAVIALLLGGCRKEVVADPGTPPSVESDSSFGVVVDVTECKDPRIPKLIKDANIGWVRQIIRWDLVEPEPGIFRWEELDAAIENLNGEGLHVYGLLLWKKWSDPTTGDDEALANWVNFVSRVVNRYKDRVRHWEVWNEPDYEFFWKPPSPAKYVKLLKATSLAAKKIDPGCKIILGGLMGWGAPYIYYPFIDDVYKNGGKDYFDIAAFHPYTMPHDPEKDNLLKLKIEDLVSRMATGGDSHKPIWITELGWPSNKLLDTNSDRGVTPDQQAEYLVKAYGICLSYPQVKKVFWYGFRDVGTEPKNTENHFGLIANDLTPKPSYFAYKTYTTNNRK